MGYDWNSSGTVTLKEGVTIEEVANAFYEAAESEDRFDPVGLFGPGQYTLHDDIDFQVIDGELSYSADSNSGWLNGVWDTFLDVVAEKFAAAAWADDRGDDSEPTFLGPNQEAIRAEKVSHYLHTIEHAVAAIRSALAAQ